MTVRDMIHAYQREIRDEPDLQPDRGADILLKLAALYGSVLDEIRKADAEYSKVLLEMLELEKTGIRAKIRAETSPEYQRKREAIDAKELALELIRSLKYWIKSKAEEYQMSGRQP